MTFAGIDPKYAQPEQSNIWLQSIPYDGTTTWGKGADGGFDAFMEASNNMELYDIETNSEVYKLGIHLLPPITENSNPDALQNVIYKAVKNQLNTDKLLTYFGGEHSISIGIIRAFKEKFESLSVLHLDAHADLRPEYNGSRFNHSCAMHEASRTTNLVQVGIRSMDASENKYMNHEKCFFMDRINTEKNWITESIDLLGTEVYISLDLDVLDPSIMPSTGTPEPGGFSWELITGYLKSVFYSKNVVGFDIVELAPIPGLNAPNFLAAKLYYKMLSYKFSKND